MEKIGVETVHTVKELFKELGENTKVFTESPKFLAKQCFQRWNL